MEAPADLGLLGLWEEIWLRRCYSPRNIIRPPRDTVIDIGANVGVFSILAASSHSNLRVVAIEPSPLMYDYLCANVAANRLTNVVTVCAACGVRGGRAILYSRGRETMNSLYTRDVYGSHFRPFATVPILSLDKMMDEYCIDRCGLLKLDCEGAEYEILLNAGPRVLDRIDQIAMEYHVGLTGHSPVELVRFLEDKAFQVVVTPVIETIDPETGFLYARK